MERKDSKITFIVISTIIGLMSTVSLSLGGFALKWVFDANAEISVMNEKLSSIQSDKAQDNRQDQTITKHWRLHSWARDQINELRQHNNLPLAPWPDVSN